MRESLQHFTFGGLTREGRVFGTYSNYLQNFGFIYGPGGYVEQGIQAPDNFDTDVTGVNGSGIVVGWFDGDNGCCLIPSGFVRVHGVYHTISFPNADWTRISGVSRDGSLIGTYYRDPFEGAFVAICTADQQPCTQ